MHPASQRGFCHLGGEGGETSPSPQLPRNCFLPTPGPSHRLRPSPPRYPTILLEIRRLSTGRLCPPTPGLGQLSPLPGSYTRACTKAPFTPPAPPSAPPSRPAALPLPTARSITVPGGGLSQLSPGQGSGRRVRCPHSRHHEGGRHSRFPSRFLLAVRQRLQRHVPPPPTYPRGSSHCV